MAGVEKLPDLGLGKVLEAALGAYVGVDGSSVQLPGEHSGRVTTFVDKYDGARLNAPNDVVFLTDGTLFFTDPPYGLPLQDEDPEKANRAMQAMLQMVKIDIAELERAYAQG